MEGHPAPNLPSLVWVEDANGHVPDGAVQGGLEGIVLNSPGFNRKIRNCF